MKKNKNLFIFFGVSLTSLAVYTFYFHDKYFSKEAKERKKKEIIEQNLERLRTEGVSVLTKPLFTKNSQGIYCIQPPCF